MADILDFQTADQAFFQGYVREHLPDRRTQDILADLKLVRMLGAEDAILRGVLFAELAERGRR